MDIKGIYSKYKYNIGKVGRIFSSDEFKNSYHFNGSLGSFYTEHETIFKIWTPVANKVSVNIYEKISENSFKHIKKQTLVDLNGIFEGSILGNLEGKYYKYEVQIENEIYEVVDPYAKAVSVNGLYGMIIDLEKTNPKGWREDKKPELLSPTDSIIYEAHVRDFTIDENSGVLNKGKFLGLAQENTKYKEFKTGLDHLKELGITHIHLLPIYDYKTVDEEKAESEYNWGYDPENYNAIEGSYSTNPFDGDFRIKELKQTILKLHESGIRVIMDVVYNHMYKVEECNFSKIVPMYYFRENEDGSYSNGSGCGNETASERSMMRKFIIDSVIYFAKEYHIDGFRFDLMGLHDIETIKEIRQELNKIDKSILIYGEGWTGGNTTLPYESRSIKENMYKYGEMQVAAFNDNIRDAVKGTVFKAEERGFANGNREFCEKLKSGIVASTRNDGVYYNWFANEPYQTITYTSVHDNYTLWDKLQKSMENEEENEIIKVNKLIAAISLTSQGINLIHAGEELLRTKVLPSGELDENSYKSGDLVNKIQWDRKEKYIDVFEYYKKLIELRKNHKIFRMEKRIDIEQNLKFRYCGENFISYEINGEALGDTFKEVIIAYNGYNWDVELDLKEKEFEIILDGKNINENGITKIKNRVIIEGRTAKILVVK